MPGSYGLGLQSHQYHRDVWLAETTKDSPRTYSYTTKFHFTLNSFSDRRDQMINSFGVAHLSISIPAKASISCARNLTPTSYIYMRHLSNVFGGWTETCPSLVIASLSIRTLARTRHETFLGTNTFDKEGFHDSSIFVYTSRLTLIY